MTDISVNELGHFDSISGNKMTGHWLNPCCVLSFIPLGTLNAHWNLNQNIKTFCQQKWIWICRLQNADHFVQISIFSSTVRAGTLSRANMPWSIRYWSAFRILNFSGGFHTFLLILFQREHGIEVVNGFLYWDTLANPQIGARKYNHTSCFLWDVIINPCPNFNG